MPSKWLVFHHDGSAIYELLTIKAEDVKEAQAHGERFFDTTARYIGVRPFENVAEMGWGLAAGDLDRPYCPPNTIREVAVSGRILVKASYAMPHDRLLEMINVLEVGCADHDAFAALPKVVEMLGRAYGLTGWNSDRGVAFYRDDAMTAVAVSR